MICAKSDKTVLKTVHHNSSERPNCGKKACKKTANCINPNVVSNPKLIWISLYLVGSDFLFFLFCHYELESCQTPVHLGKQTGWLVLLGLCRLDTWSWVGWCVGLATCHTSSYSSIDVCWFTACTMEDSRWFLLRLAVRVIWPRVLVPQQPPVACSITCTHATHWPPVIF